MAGTVLMKRITWLFFALAFSSLNADHHDGNHWGTAPPVPELNVFHYPAMGIVEISFMSDSQPGTEFLIWYILEVKQEGDPNAEWFRPFNPLQGTTAGQMVFLELNYRNAAGQVQPWFTSEMVRIRVMWGA